MKILTNKKLTQKIIIAIVIMLSFNFIAPTYSKADWGGVLLDPLAWLVAGLGDTVMNALYVFMDGSIDELKWDLMKSLDNVTNDDLARWGMEPTGSSEDEIKTISTDTLSKGAFGLAGIAIPVMKYSPEQIFANKVPGLDANFINPKFDDNKKSIASELQKTISSWYNALRNLVLVFLLSELLYVGIRMMLTSIASDKAKYKQMLMDWFIAMCLLFFLHYIMSFIMTFITTISEQLGESTEITVQLDDLTFTTNLSGYCRLKMQSLNASEKIAFLVFYIAIVTYTVKFTFSYMKRALTLAFLTILAPLVTLTYPLDKMGDGKSQAFNLWLKEYLFNALLQPFHLIIYTVFLGGAMNLAVDNPIYAILLFAFMSEAEKLFRKFFKFDQATTANGSAFAAGFGGAAAMGAIKSLARGARAIGKGANNAKQGIREHNKQGQLQDPNSPRGLDAFANDGTEGQEGGNPINENAEGQENGNQGENLGYEGMDAEKARSEQARIDGDRAVLNELAKEMQSEEELDYLIQEEARINKEQEELKRKTGEGQKPIRQMAAENEARRQQASSSSGSSSGSSRTTPKRSIKRRSRSCSRTHSNEWLKICRKSSFRSSWRSSYGNGWIRLRNCWK